VGFSPINDQKINLPGLQLHTAQWFNSDTRSFAAGEGIDVDELPGEQYAKVDSNAEGWIGSGGMDRKEMKRLVVKPGGDRP
jgi:hypothetical protein